MARILVLLAMMVLISRGEDSKDNAVGPPPLQIDPQLRKALLQALTQLEKEAQEENNLTTELPEENSTDNYEFPSTEQPVEIDSYQKPPDTETEGGEEEKPPPEQEIENLNFQSFDKVKINLGNKSEKDQQKDTVKPSVQNKPETTLNKESVDVQSNEISVNKSDFIKPELVESISLPVKETQDFEDKAGKEEEVSNTNVNPKIEENKNANASDKEVAFFEAPLVAAFTLHHDENGLPKSVVPLFRQEQPAASSQSETFSLSKEQELEQRTIKLQEQLLQLQQQQIQQQQLIKQQQLLKDAREQESLRQQRVFQEQQERQARQQRFQFQLQPQQASQLFPQEQQAPRLRSQRQEQGTAIIDFQKSLDVPFRTTPAPVTTNFQFPPRLAANFQNGPNFFRSQQQQTFNTFNSNFNKNDLNTNFNTNNLNANFNNNLNSNFDNFKRNNFNNFQPSQQNFISSQSQQYRTIVEQEPSDVTGSFRNSNFNKNNFNTNFNTNNVNTNFRSTPSFSNNINTFQTTQATGPSFSNNFDVFQTPPPVTSSFATNFNTFQTPPSIIPSFTNNINTFQQPPTVDTQLKSLLFQSGIAGDLQNNIRNGASPIEDLNILSKVLLLDPESHRERSGRTTQEGHHVQVPSRQHSTPRL